MKQTWMMALAAVAFGAVTASAQSARMNTMPRQRAVREIESDLHDGRKDKREIQVDAKDLRVDRRELVEDKREGEKGEVRRDLREIQSDKKDLRVDRRDVTSDRRDVRRDVGRYIYR